IGSNTSGVDVYYTNPGDQSLHYFDGTDHALGGKCLQICAGLNAYGQHECYVIGTDNALYKFDTYGNSAWEGGQMTQITTASNDQVFAVQPVTNQIWTYDPNNVWGGGWWYYYAHGMVNAPYWSYAGGITANPFAI